MTADEIKALPAGRDLDAAAGRQFPDLVKGGWCLQAVSPSGAKMQAGPSCRESWSLEEAQIKCAAWRARERGWDDATWSVVPWLFDPSEDLAVAWKVAETMIAAGWEFDIGSLPPNERQGFPRQWEAEFRKRDEVGCFRVWLAAAAPEAIVKAALLAKLTEAPCPDPSPR